MVADVGHFPAAGKQSNVHAFLSPHQTRLVGENAATPGGFFPGGEPGSVRNRVDWRSGQWTGPDEFTVCGNGSN